MIPVSREITIEDKCYITVEFDGTKMEKYWNDPYLKKILVDAVKDVLTEDKDLFDFANFLYAQINQSVKRRYSGQELMLKSVEAYSFNGDTVTVSR